MAEKRSTSALSTEVAGLLSAVCGLVIEFPIIDQLVVMLLAQNLNIAQWQCLRL
jgi:hypothetical protein